jgi:hypothetical protein
MKLDELKDYDEEHKCKTPGAMYATKFHDDSIGIRITLPKGITVPGKEAAVQELEVDLHYAIEKVLARLFK